MRHAIVARQISDLPYSVLNDRFRLCFDNIVYFFAFFRKIIDIKFHSCYTYSISYTGGDMKMENKKWTHIRVSVEVRHALKVYAACHNITMSNAIIDLIRKVEAVKPQQ